jgi:hypothetical protein
VRLNTKLVVGRGGLEPPTSALTRPMRCRCESGNSNVVRGCYQAREQLMVSVSLIRDSWVKDERAALIELDPVRGVVHVFSELLSLALFL